jgi:D-alanyl-lipoteichoic acid acyltransferase DltB (MBOAT superfamily)
VGISFYTFQTLSYTFDLYRGKISTERNLLNFSLFVAFFPQLVAGPIERASHLLPQMRTASRFTWENLSSGFYLIASGLFKKVVIADNIGKVADAVFAVPNPTGLDVVIGVYAFAIQIYCDFSGYSDIARGTARCLGFDLMLNFNLPYFATNPSDFWQRWHISLSTWLRDYLYIPLGGNKKGPRRTYINLMFTMVLGGLWHGAAWTFVLWGVFHALLLILHRLMGTLLRRFTSFQSQVAQNIWLWLRIGIFFQLVCVSWLLFRAESMAQVWSFATIVLTAFTFNFDAINRDLMRIFLASSAVFWSIQLLQYLRGDLLAVLRLPMPVRTVTYAVGILSFLWFGEYGGHAFIYFQF